MTVPIPDDVTTELIAGETSRIPSKALWIQNFSTTVGFNLHAAPGSSQDPNAVTVGADLYLGPAASATQPSTFLTDNPALVCARWLARQDSGGAVNLNVGRI